MTVENQQFKVYRGTAPLFVFSPSTPTPTAGWTVQMTWRPPNASTPALVKAATNADAVNGVWNIP